MKSKRLFAFVLAICFCSNGCGRLSNSEGMPTGIVFDNEGQEAIVGGIAYVWNGFSMYVEEKKNHAVIIVVYRKDAGTKIQGGFTRLHDDRDRISGVIFFEDGHRIPVDIDCIYFIEGNTIRIGKPCSDLKINPADRSYMSPKNLQPILEKLIRENLPKSESKQEPENVK